MVLQLLLGTLTVFAAEDETVTYTEPESPAVTYNMNIDWKFTKATGTVYPLASAAASVVDSNGKQFYEVEYDDSEWETVSVPHAPNAEDSFDDNCYDSGESGIWRGFMFYRKHITVPESDAGKKLFLEFEAVRQSVYLYVNGEMVGYYEAGITAMGFDITNYINVGEDNVIAVATDNSSDRGQSDSTLVTHETKPGSAAGAADGSTFQWNTKDFNEVQGGITGNVNLYAKNEIYQTLPLYNNLKTTGNYIYASDFDIREKTATITVEGEIRNESDSAKDITLEVNVVDNDGNLTASFSQTANAAAATDAGEVYQTVVPDDAYEDAPAATNANTVDVTKITASAEATDLRFWSPDSPYLYDVYTVLKDSDGNVLDVQKTTTGFRKVEYDIEDGGLKINDSPVWLTGYAQRSTNEWAVIGVANDWLQDLDMQWIKESNSNFIRWMHVAPKPSQIRSGDKYGVVSVVPAGDKEGDVDGRQWDQRVEAMRDAMIYYRNSPSVIFWEAGNASISAEHQQEMTDMKNLIDPNGGRFSGCRSISSTDQIEAADYVGTMLNRYASSATSAMSSANKYVPIVETEYARDEAPRRVWDDYSPPDYDYDNKWLGDGASKTDGYDVWDETSEDFAITDVGAYNEFYTDRVGGSSGNDYYTAAAIMVWSDSNMHNRNTGSENCRTSGKVDAVRIKKEAFYAMQAAQATEPTIHIVGHWNYPEYNDENYWYDLKTYNGTYWEKTGEQAQRDPTKKTVYVIGSADVSKIELYVNDSLVGTCSKPTNSFVYSFSNIDVTQSGEVSAIAYDARDEIIAEDAIATAGDPATIRLTPVTGPDGLIADGSDIAYFDVEVVDADGNVCPLSYDKINLSISGNGVLLGGYNSGIDDKITTHKDYVYAECGTNRVFVRSTRDAGAITLSAAFDGQAAVTSTITSTALELTDGLTTEAQRSYAQGEVPEVINTEVAPLKAMAGEFTVDFDEESGNTEIVDPLEDVDTYKVQYNGADYTSEYTSVPYRPDSTTGVLCDVITTLDILKQTANPNIEYTVVTEGDLPTGYDGALPYVSITGGLKDGYTQIDVVSSSTTLFINGGEDKNLMNAEVEANGDEVIVDIAVVLGYIDSVSYSLNTNSKTANMVGAAVDGNTSSAFLEYADGTARVTAISPVTGGNLIFASYDGNALENVSMKKVNLESMGSYSDYALPTAFADADDVKIMLWASDMATPLCDYVAVNDEDETVSVSSIGGTVFYDDSERAAKNTDSDEDADYIDADYEVLDYDVDEEIELASADVSLFEEQSPGEVQTLDELIAKHECETTSKDGATITEGAPDESNYIKTGDSAVCMQSEFTYGSNTKEDIMFSLDVRFDAEYGGFCAEDDGDKKVAGAIVLRNSLLQVQKGSGTNDYNSTGISIDSSTWYHISMVGRYSASDANIDMYVWKYGDDGSLTYLGSAESIALRNLSQSNNNGASHLNILANTSVDNLCVSKLNADTLTLTASADTVKAGATQLFSVAATRAGGYITTPSVTWEVYDANDENILNDDEISISDAGLLNVGSDASKQTINVRATSTVSDTVYASKAVTIDAIDKSTDTYDTLTLSAEGDTVRVNEPLTLTAAATLDDETVDPISEDDLFWYVYNEGNLREVGNKNITIDNGVLSVTKDVVPQTVTVKAMNLSGSVSGTYTVEVLPANMNYDNEDEYTDTFASSNACEEYISDATLTEGSWDGSGYYNITSAYNFDGFSSDTTADVIYSADMQFANDGAGWTVYNSSKGKLGLQLSSSGTTLNAIGASNKVVGSMAIDNTSWYNIQIMCATGNSGTGTSYARLIVYKYDEDGNKVHPSTGEVGVPYVSSDVALRNLDESSANHICVNAGTNVDNVISMYVSPDTLELSLDTESVLAGATAQATTTASRKGVVFPYLSSSLISYEIYDSDNAYPLGNDKITIDATGKITIDALADAQDVYVRVSSTSGGMSDSVKLTIKSSDIFEITSAGFEDDTYSVLKRIKVNKNFYYNDDVTFVVEVYDENGAMTAVKTKKAYGDQLSLGENKIAINLTLPEDFDKTTDTIKAYVVTNLSTSTQTDGAELALASSTVSNIPSFDDSAKVTVLVLAAGADETSVTDSDIMYYTQLLGSDITDNTLTLPMNIESGMTVKIAGNVSGIHTIAVGVLE
ncbi:MAG: hypothetical protein LIO59_00385 [Oscillospiraceae bacterium]|nr:hypothetical protein [Oscillospiraceae bacterium]